MSFRFGTPWNFWLLLSAVITVTFVFTSSRLSQKTYRFVKILLSFLLALALVVDAFLNSGGLFVFGGRATAIELLFFTAPIVSPFVMLVALVSNRWAAAMMWVLFLIQHSYLSSINWPSLSAMAMVVCFDWPLLMSAVILSVFAFQEKRRKAAQSASVGSH